MNIGKDLKEYLDEQLEFLVLNHLNIWNDRYYEKSLEDVVFDYKTNHDADTDFEYIEDEILERDLTDEEKRFIKDEFVREIEKIYCL